ncbi:MAG: DUF6612 family protein [Euryarchaeota archaeon]|nr:DUF6612 family protein [Euryarchaeota archaeon]
MKSKNIAGLIAIAAIVVVVMLAGCVEENQANKAELAQKILASEDNIDTYKYDMTMTQDTLLKNETGETTFAQENTGKATIDFTSKKMKMEMTTSLESQDNAGMGERTMEVYLIDKILYMKMDMGIPQLPAQWTKREMPGEYVEFWKSQNQLNQQMELLNISEVEVLKEETMNSEDCYVLKVTPDMEKYGELSGLMQGLQQGVDIGQLIKEMSVKYWIAKDTKFPVKAETVMEMEISSNDLKSAGEKEDFTMTSNLRTTIDFYDYNKPVTIELPEEAENAAGMEMPQMNMTRGNATKTQMIPPMNDTEQSATT